MSTYAVTTGYKYSPGSGRTFEYAVDVEAGDQDAAIFLAGIKFGTASNNDVTSPVVTYVGVVQVPESELEESKGDA